ncbi:MAG: MFS transporter [Alphaproteobacteria bacterium]|nr:MFS transporter [Alphaproteobacteria bacterium]MBT5389803.1 MFS transporter [Alphaproteobacteria bacterium]MBT5540129.1 MFS transporter [Alphaproteobacteria bacterium]MBT5654023.1 MFS transporter [Alphaproteobacteria bacterium]
MKKKSIFTICLGTMLEYYDIFLYGSLILVLSPLFFPHEDPEISRLFGLVVFAAGFILRPISGLLFGYFGDKFGRKKPLQLSMFFISLPTLMIGLLPTFSEIGIWAPILLLICRLVQNFFVAGEFAGASVLLLENAPEGKKAYTGGILYMGTCFALLLSFCLGYIFTNSAIPSWGWRVPFVLGGVFGLFGYFLRRLLPESEDFLRASKGAGEKFTSLKSFLKSEHRNLVYILGLITFVALPYNLVFLYSPQYLIRIFGFSSREVIAFCIPFAAILTVSNPLMGACSDRFGIKKVCLASAVLFLISSSLFFLFLNPNMGLSTVFIFQILFCLSCATATGATMALKVLVFPTRMRYRGVGLGEALGMAVFTGCTSLICAWLVKATGSEMAPLLFVCPSMLFGIFSLHKIKVPSREKVAKVSEKRAA